MIRSLCSSTTTSLFRSSLLQAPLSRALTYTQETTKKRVTLIPGDGIGPELVDSVLGVFGAAKVPVDWEIHHVHAQSPSSISGLKGSPQIPQEVITSIIRNKVALKGPFYTSSGVGAPSRNLELRKALDMYAHVIPAKHIEGIATRHSDLHVDIVVIRENTQGEYTGLEQELTPGVVQSLKITTRESATRIARYAFEYAKNEGRKSVTAIHKANIMKQTDGLFLECCREVAKDYPSIQFSDMIIDNCCMQLVMKPQQFDVMVTPNLYGNLVTNVVSALVGGPGLTPGANVGNSGIAVFEAGAHHVAADIAGHNKANPIGILLSSTLLLKHINLPKYAQLIEEAVHHVVKQKVLTVDVGGTSTTKQFTQAVIDRVNATKDKI